jgi:hypothetical protein
MPWAMTKRRRRRRRRRRSRRTRRRRRRRSAQTQNSQIGHFSVNIRASNVTKMEKNE